MTNNHYQQSSQLALVSLGILVLILMSSNLLILALIQLTLWMMLYFSDCLIIGTRRKYYLLCLFLFFAVLPLLVEFVGIGEPGEIVCGWGVSANSIRLSLLVYMRALGTSSLIYLFLHYIPFYQFCRLLRLWSVPKLFVELLELSYRYSNSLMEQSLRMYEAQKLRLGYQKYSHKLEHAGLLFSQSFILGHKEAEEVFDGLISRQFYSEKSDDKESLDDKCQYQENLHRPISLQIKRVTYSYDRENNEALKEVSIDIRGGERIVLLGANGAGKSTLMHILSGLKREQRGVLVLNGQELDRVEKTLRLQRKTIALVMQNANHQLFCPTVEDEVSFGLRNVGETESNIQKKIEEIIQKFELEPLRYLPPHQLSEGQKKWVSIAAIMALNPQIILMDEPTACLDNYYTDKVLSFTNEFCASGGTVVLSTHDMNLAYEWGRRVLVMSSGRLVYDGGLDQLFSDSSLLVECKLKAPYGFRSLQFVSSKKVSTESSHKLALFHNTALLKALIYGAGSGARRKAETLLISGVEITLIAPEIDDSWIDLKEKYPHFTCYKDAYPAYSNFISTHHLIVAATGIPSIDTEICDKARKYGLLYSNLSNAEQSNVHFAASVDKAGIQVAVHSAYRLPELTQCIRNLIEERIDEDNCQVFEDLSAFRDAKDRANYEITKQKLISKLEYDWSHRS